MVLFVLICHMSVTGEFDLTNPKCKILNEQLVIDSEKITERQCMSGSITRLPSIMEKYPEYQIKKFYCQNENDVGRNDKA